ncbi:hypothetical protein KIW84_057228 [Lathyrus oleraceus]|uniref:Gag-pol polyprotein n=1 Tax=Pisum sativum TaxID=3888 RepID=A0A9D4X2K8_PEA|nr:hypothetical protein KIW84_057228 [Pisum sativum]
MLYSHGSEPVLSGYCDADWAGSADDRKSTSEAEYIAAGSSCSQLVWMKQMLTEYNVTQNVMTLLCDNLSAINISKNPIQHSRTKHIDIRHHFIRDLVEDKVITLEHVATDLHLADIFTKALDATQFENLRSKLGIYHSYATCNKCGYKRVRRHPTVRRPMYLQEFKDAVHAGVVLDVRNKVMASDMVVPTVKQKSAKLYSLFSEKQTQHMDLDVKLNVVTFIPDSIC